MVRIVIKIFCVATGLWIAARYVPNLHVASFWPTAVIAATVLAMINVAILPVVRLLTLPVTILTLGVFAFLLNVLGFWLITYVPGVDINSFFAAVAGLLIVTLCSWAADVVIEKG